MIRVLQYGLTSHLGGIETYLYKLYKNIDRDKFKFDFLIVGNEKPCWYDEFINMGSDFYTVTPASKNPYKNRKEIQEIIRQQEIDIIHCNLNSLSNIEIVKAGIKNKIPTIVHSRNAGISMKGIYKILHKYNKLTLPIKEINMIAVSDFAGKWMFGEKAKFEIINNGIDIKKYKFNIEKRKGIRKELGIANELTIVNVGAFREQKNHMFLLEIFSEILKENKNAKLILVGDGELRNCIIQKINNLKINKNVILMGNRNDIGSILSASDLFLFPSLFEGFPNAVLEAQTSGLPCLISDTITEQVCVNSNCEYMSLNEGPQQWAENILNLSYLNNYENIRVRYAQNIEDSGFSVKDEIIKIQKLYERLIRKEKIQYENKGKTKI